MMMIMMMIYKGKKKYEKECERKSECARERVNRKPLMKIIH